jgi:transport system permease protein
MKERDSQAVPGPQGGTVPRSAHFLPPGLLRWALAVAALLLVVLAAFALGKFPIGPADLARIVWARISGSETGLPPAMETVIWNIRLPRIGAALLVGAVLSAAGAAYQGMFRNPLVSPDILGVSAGAGLGAVLAIWLGLPLGAVQGFAFVGGACRRWGRCWGCHCWCGDMTRCWCWCWPGWRWARCWEPALHSSRRWQTPPRNCRPSPSG